MTRWFLAGALALAAASLTVRASAAPEGDEMSRAESEDAAAHRFPRDLAFHGGLRVVFAADPGLGPYMTTGSIPELALGASLPLLRQGRFSLAALAEWDVGSRSASTRGDTTSLTVNRLAGGFEGRLALAPRLYAFARLAPSATHVGASIDDVAASGRPLEAGGWTWGLDATGGAALMIGGGPRTRFHLWLVADAGYGFSGAVPMRFAPPVEVGDPRTFGAVQLPDARTQGAVGALNLALAM
jgi:hypothetical protein